MMQKKCQTSIPGNTAKKMFKHVYRKPPTGTSLTLIQSVGTIGPAPCLFFPLCACTLKHRASMSDLVPCTSVCLYPKNQSRHE